MSSEHTDHLDETAVERLISGELSPAEEAAARGHERRCAECSRRVTEAMGEKSEIFSLLERLDEGVAKVVDVESVVARARALGIPATRRSRSNWSRWAAGFLLAIGIAGAAYAIPGSPVRAWVDAVMDRIVPGGADRPAGNAGAPVSGVVPPGVSAAGVSVEPGTALLIRFTAAGERSVRISLTGGSDVVVRAPAGAASYDSGPDILTINPRGSAAMFEIAIPRTAPRVEVRVGDERIFLQERGQVTAASPPDSEGAYTLPLGASIP
jgi:anti-sigma factor RsiW